MNYALKLPLIHKVNPEKQSKRSKEKYSESVDLSTVETKQKEMHPNTQRQLSQDSKITIFQKRTTTHSLLPNPAKYNTIQNNYLAQSRQQTDINEPKLMLREETTAGMNHKHRIIKKNTADYTTQLRGETLDKQFLDNANYRVTETDTDRLHKEKQRRKDSYFTNTKESERTSKDKEPKLVSLRQTPSNLLIHFGYKQRWTKKLKALFQAARALCRLQILIRPKRKQWDKQTTIEIACNQELQFNTKINGIKIKQWCQMIFTKAFSVINSKEISSWKLNFIENQLSALDLDNAINFTTSICWYVLTSLLQFTTQHYFVRELGLMMYEEQFVKKRKSFNKFVTTRTLYLSEINKVISNYETAMIYSESILFHHLLSGFMTMINNPKLADLTEPNTVFLIKIIISVLQYLFLETFKTLPRINTTLANCQLHQFQLEWKSITEIKLKQIPQIEDSLYVVGIFKTEDLQPLLNKKPWKKSINIIFKRILRNLFNYKL